MQTEEQKIQEKRIAVFFYGSFMRRDVMARGGFHPAHIEVAKLSGFDIRIDPHANIVRSDQHCIYGILVQATHKELNSLYSMDGVGVFLPEAVNVELQNGRLQAAFCYIPPARTSKPADKEYLARLITTTQEYEFPAWYVQKLKNML
jgi:Gamma-glutamyl cyclotransferase, AIG2-like